MRLPIVDGQSVDTNFIHTDHFVLIDRNRNVRGYYHSLDSTSLQTLSEDIIFLSLEKDRSKKSVFEGKLELIAIFILTALAIIGFLLLLFRKGANK